VAPEWAAAVYAHTAFVLFDRAPAFAVRSLRISLNHPVPLYVRTDDRRALQALLSVVDGAGVDADTVIDVLDAFRHGGRPRRAGRLAGYFVLAMASAGDAEGAAAVLAWMDTHGPEPTRRIPIEHQLVADARRAVEQAFADENGLGHPVVAVSLLRPVVEVSVGDDLVPLGDPASRLLAVLALDHPAPVHVDTLSERLWPDEDVTATRSRLNTIVHRIRRSLGEHAAVLVRREDTLGLAPSGCRVDLTELRRSRTAPAREQVALLAGVTGCMAHAQFPFDEHLVAARHAFVAEWLTRAQRLVALGSAVPAEFTDALSVLELGPEDLVPVAR
jgi:hypothetical protein